jgi:transposase
MPCVARKAADPAAAASASYSKRQVMDLPEPQALTVTEHRAHCLADFPEGVTAPVQYGARITALAVYLRTCHFIPEDRLAELLQDLFGLGISTATIAAMEQRKAEELAPVAEAIGGKAKQAPVKHTGYRVGGRTQWLHVAATVLLTFHRTSAKRGALPADAVERKELLSLARDGLAEHRIACRANTILLLGDSLNCERVAKGSLSR